MSRKKIMKCSNKIRTFVRITQKLEKKYWNNVQKTPGCCLLLLQPLPPLYPGHHLPPVPPKPLLSFPNPIIPRPRVSFKEVPQPTYPNPSQSSCPLTTQCPFPTSLPNPKHPQVEACKRQKPHDYSIKKLPTRPIISI